MTSVTYEAQCFACIGDILIYVCGRLEHLQLVKVQIVEDVMAFNFSHSPSLPPSLPPSFPFPFSLSLFLLPLSLSLLPSISPSLSCSPSLSLSSSSSPSSFPYSLSSLPSSLPFPLLLSLLSSSHSPSPYSITPINNSCGSFYYNKDILHDRRACLFEALPSSIIIFPQIFKQTQQHRIVKPAWYHLTLLL